jgi:hypothetical protein
MATPRRARGTAPAPPVDAHGASAMPRSELASRIARWRTGEPAGADDADARASSGPSKFWWQNSPAKPAAPPPPSRRGDQRARARERRRRGAHSASGARGHHRQGARRRARRGGQRVRFAERGVGGEGARAPLREQPRPAGGAQPDSPRARRTRRRRVSASRGGDHARELREVGARQRRDGRRMGRQKLSFANESRAVFDALLRGLLGRGVRQNARPARAEQKKGFFFFFLHRG